MSGILAALAGIKTAIATAVDEYFNRVTLLLNTSSTNGAQNNTFLDSSTNNFTITRNGNTTQGTFTPFSQTGWSNYFSSNYISASATLISTTATTFTMEGWIYMTATPVSGGNVPGLCGDMLGSATTNYMSFGPLANGTLGFQWFNGSTNVTAAGNTVMSLNTWYHVAISVNSSAIKMFVNGVDQTITGTSTLTNRGGTSSTFTVGYNSTQASITGYVSNLRVTNTAVYTGTFTPSTAPLTAISGTLFLTAQSNRFIDNSTNNYAITATSSPSVQAFSPFAPTAAYDTAVVGGSGYFDGTGDYLVTPSNAAVSSTLLGSDFTIECWLYLTTYPGGGAPIWTNSTSNSDGFSSAYVTSSGTIALGKVGVNEVASTATIVRNAWNHFATVRSGATVYLYLNGIQVASGAASTYLNTSSAKPLQIAQSNQSTPSNLTGYISGYRVVSSALYTGSTYTIPTAPPTAISGTQLLLNCTNGGIYDSAAKNVLETVGNAQVSTTQAKWGTTSMGFDGTGDYLFAPPSEQFNITGGAYTVEMWINFASTSGTNIICGFNGKGTTGSWQLLLDSGTLYWQQRGSAVNQTSYSWSPSTSTWYHVAVTWDGTTLRIFVNGTSVATNTSSPAFSTTQNGINIGGASDGYSINGYIDDFRITKYARYTSAFTAPTAAFPLQ